MSSRSVLTPASPEDHYREFQKYRLKVLKTSPITAYNLVFMPYQMERMDQIEEVYFREALKEKTKNG